MARRGFADRLHTGLRLVAVGVRTAVHAPRLLLAPFLSGVATLAVFAIVAAAIGPAELLSDGDLSLAGQVGTLVVPVILYEEPSLIRAMKRSVQLFRRVWGEQLVGSFGLGLAMTVLSFAAVVVAVPLMFLHVAVGLVAAVVLLVGLQLVGAVAGGAFKAALYQYATSGSLPVAYSPHEAALA